MPHTIIQKCLHIERQNTHSMYRIKDKDDEPREKYFYSDSVPTRNGKEILQENPA